MQRLYGSELVIYDRHSRCLLFDGDYELAMKEIVPNEINGASPVGGVEKSPLKANTTWTPLETPAASTSNLLTQYPTLKFRLQWVDEAIPAMVDRYTSPSHECFGNQFLNFIFIYILLFSPKAYATMLMTAQMGEKSSSSSSTTSSLDKVAVNGNGDEAVTAVRYQFLYNSSRRQQTETRTDFQCPWCSLHCLQLSGLLKHLRLCHSRFIFNHIVSLIVTSQVQRLNFLFYFSERGKGSRKNRYQCQRRV